MTLFLTQQPVYYMQHGEVKMASGGCRPGWRQMGILPIRLGRIRFAVLAKENGIPFYCAVPTSTVDLSLASGDLIPIEERDLGEVRAPYGNALVPEHFKARNPAFDVTPHRYVAGFYYGKGDYSCAVCGEFSKSVAG